ncbi:hypothetical protein RDWZM_006386 [Blomia tropicalis]|uniref:glutathione transferase n=1 Tax=Blomia tropicalis TaxID=40697 RepID=A0A9Q0M7Z5_BLOTA|nr:hypothetical protein RDWZM_006386 [Blomia tropicalis]
MSSKPVLAYFNGRARGEPPRLLLRYIGIDFEDKRYSFDHKTRTSAWFEEKSKLGLDFPKLPYYIDGEVKLTQSLAILRYLARKHKLDGATEMEKNRIAMLEQQSTTYGRGEREFEKKLQTDLALLDKFLGSNRYVAGENISYVDFWLYEYLHNIRSTEWVNKSETLDKCSNLTKFEQSIQSLPQLSAYLKEINAKPDF